MSFIASWFGGGKKESASPAALPATPTTSQAEDTAKSSVAARKRKRTNTILTSPLGDQEEATILSPSLLGTGEGKQTLG